MGNLQLDLTGQFPSASISATVQAAQPDAVNHTFWYISRATGFSAYAVLFLNVCLGLALSARSFDRILARWQALDLHQFTGFLALALTALHMVVLLGDRYVGFSLDQVLVPFASTYRPFWIATGIVSFYSLLVVALSYYVRQLIGVGAWRVLHYATFGLYLVALGHSAMSGTDTAEPWARLLYVGTTTTVAILTLWRVGTPGPSKDCQSRKDATGDVAASQI